MSRSEPAGARRAGADHKRTAAGRSRRPGGAGEAKAGAFEGAVINAPGDAAKRGHPLGRQPCFEPSLFKRAAAHVDDELLRVGAAHFGIEQPPAVGDEVQKGATETDEVGGGEGREASAHFRAAAVGHSTHDRLRLGFPQPPRQFLEHGSVEQGARLVGGFELALEESYAFAQLLEFVHPCFSAFARAPMIAHEAPKARSGPCGWG